MWVYFHSSHCTQGWYVIIITSFWWTESELRNEISTENPKNAHRCPDDSFRAPYSLNQKGSVAAWEGGEGKSTEIDETPWQEFQRLGDVTSTKSTMACKALQYSEDWRRGLWPEVLGSNPKSATSWLCELEQVIQVVLCLGFLIHLTGSLWGLNKLTHGK